jgi:hypothetical protein
MKLRLFAFIIAIVVLFLEASQSFASGSQILTGHVPEAVSRLHLPLVSYLPDTNRLRLSIGLPFRNAEALTNLLQQIYNRKNPSYHHFLTPSQFTKEFGPSVNDYQSVVAFAETNGLTVGKADPGRLLVHVTGTIADVNRIFHVHLGWYQHPTENRLFFAPDVEPSVDLGTKVLYISGLNNYDLPRPAGLSMGNSPGALPGGGSGPLGSLLGRDFRAAYAPNVSLTGTGQTVGLVEFDYYYTNDVTAYENLTGLSTNIVITSVFVGSASNAPSTNANFVSEVSLDIEMAISMAPGATFIVYDGDPVGTADADNLFSEIANSDAANQISSSWLFTPDAITEQYFEEFAAQSQTFFQCSGDQDAYYQNVSNVHAHSGRPADDPNVISVGGTTLTIGGPGGAWVSETVWNEFNNTRGTNGSGGGISTNYPIPSWQTNVNMSLNGGSTTNRNIPDVAMAAENLWIIDNSNRSSTASGTSGAAPLWAALMALVNEDAAAHGRPPVGMFNQDIYTLCEGPGYGALFHDITTGNNTNFINPDNVYYAVPGYDLCTGWGTPKGMNLIDALAVSDPLTITPNTGFSASGALGGLFSPTNQTLYLTNSGSASLSWSATSLSSWLSASITNGVLLPGQAPAAIGVELTPAAETLPDGLFTGYVVVSNLTLNTEQQREFTLQVGLNPLTFDDLPSTNGVGLLPGYAGLYWNNASFLDGLLTSLNPSGYQAGTVSPPNVIYNPSGNPATIIGITPFDLLSVYATAAWEDNLQLEAKTYIGNVLMYNVTNTLSATAPTLLNYNFYGVNRVVFSTSGGTPHSGYGSTGEQFVMDNLLIVTHNNPSPQVQIQNIGRNGSTSVLKCNAQVGQSYQLQFNNNLNNNNWTNIGTPVTAARAFLTISNTTGNTQRFYRLEEIP